MNRMIAQPVLKSSMSNKKKTTRKRYYCGSERIYNRTGKEKIVKSRHVKDAG